MAKLGHISSTAITGEKSPAFIKSGAVPTSVASVEKQDEAALQLKAAHEKIDQLTDLFAKFLATQTPVVVEEKVEPTELTAGQKAAQTRAENKAKAEADTASKAGE